MKTGLALLVFSLSALGAAAPAFAHHSFAMYERDKTITLSGTVKQFVWTSPHVTIQVLTDNGKTAATTWSIEGSSPSVLARGGWTSTLLRRGDRVSLGVHPRKDGAPGGVLADEQQLLINGQPARGVLWLQPSGAETCER
jgi:hypothetical protein